MMENDYFCILFILCQACGDLLYLESLWLDITWWAVVIIWNSNVNKIPNNVHFERIKSIYLFYYVMLMSFYKANNVLVNEDRRK